MTAMEESVKNGNKSRHEKDQIRLSNIGKIQEMAYSKGTSGELNTEEAHNLLQKLNQISSKNKSNTLVAKADAETFKMLSEANSAATNEYVKDARAITVHSFGEKIKRFLNLDVEESERFADFGKGIRVFFTGIPTNQFLLKAVEKPEKPRHQREKRKAAEIIGPSTQVNAMQDTKEVAKEKRPRAGVVTKIRNAVKNRESNGAEIIPILINGKSFTQTVENIFECSFAVKDNILSLENVGGRCLAHAIDLQDYDSSAEGKKNNQSILTFSKATWHDIMDAFHIKDTILETRTGDVYKGSD